MNFTNPKLGALPDLVELLDVRVMDLEKELDQVKKQVLLLSKQIIEVTRMLEDDNK